MIRQTKGGGEGKKRQEKVEAGRPAPSLERESAVEEVFEDIDPADFFDPEEFVAHRRNPESFRP